MWRFYSNSGSYCVESYSLVCQGWPKTSFLQLVGNMTRAKGASGNFLFATQQIDLYASIYSIYSWYPDLWPHPFYISSLKSVGGFECFAAAWHVLILMCNLWMMSLFICWIDLLGTLAIFILVLMILKCFNDYIWCTFLELYGSASTFHHVCVKEKLKY